VAVGEPALDALEHALLDLSTPARVRMHIPQAMARFGSQRAADLLASAVDDEPNGLVRYKALRALGQLVSDSDVVIDRRRTERATQRNLEEHLRLLSMCVALDAQDGQDEAGRLLRGLLEDKVRQSLERAFRLLKIAHRREDIHRVHIATESSDLRLRANASEFLDALLVRRDQQPLRALLRLVMDPATQRERVARAVAEGRVVARTREQSLRMLIENDDDALAALAVQHALGLEGAAEFRKVVELASERRPSLRDMLDRFFGAPAPLPREGTGG
jgi:HEAT repeat protein